MVVALYFGLGLIIYSIGYWVGRVDRKSETPVVEPKLISTPAKAIVLKRASQISPAEKMSALGVNYDDMLKNHMRDLCNALAEDAKAYVRFETDVFEDYDADTITATLVVYDINEEKR